MYNIYIEMRAMPAPRPRFAKFGRTYNLQKYTNYKTQISHFLKQKIKQATENAVAISIDFFFKSKSKSKKKGNMVSRPDIDNLVKGILDAMNNIVFLDDRQVISIQARKQYATIDAIKIEIAEIE